MSLDGELPVVLHLISSLNVGGAERLLVSTVETACAMGKAPYVVAIMNEGVDAGLYRTLEETGVPLYRLGRREGHMHPQYLKVLLDIVDRHDVRIVHTHNEGSRFWGMLLRMIRPRLRLVYTVHSEGNVARFTGWKRFAYRRLVDATVAISPFIAEETRPVGVKNLTLIENGVDLARFSAVPRQIGGPLLRLVCVGRYAHAKGQDILIEAIGRCVRNGVDVGCELAGVASEPAFFDRLKAHVVSLGLTERVTFTLGRTDVETILAGADVFVLPSREEGFGLVLIEAMAAGLPVVAARTGGAANLVDDDVNGLCFPVGDDAALAQCVARLAGDAQARARLAEAGRATAQRYDIRRTVQAHADLYRRLAGSA